MQTKKKKTVEDYPAGYPRFSALVSACDSYFICRRFSHLRARLLLQKQDQIAVLEHSLEQLDQEEPCTLFLGQTRGTGNLQRGELLSEIDSRLADYDDFVWRARFMLHIDSARPRDIESLQNWINGTGCIARAETSYLARQQDLVSLGRQRDNAVQQLETWVEDKLVFFWRGFRKSFSNKHHDLSENPHVYLYSGPLVRRVARILLLALITILLMVPIIVCNVVSTDSVRIIVVTLSTVSYLLVLSALTESRTMELILAGATYATILTVFVSGTSNVGN